LSWNASTDNRGVTGYKIYRNTAYLTTVTSNSRSDLGLIKNTSYCYRVSAVDAAGNESGQSSQACATTLDSWTKQWGTAADEEARGIFRTAAAIFM
jgi:chitodextrinase